MKKTYLNKLAVTLLAISIIETSVAQPKDMTADPIKDVIETLRHVDTLFVSSKAEHILSSATLISDDQLDCSDIDTWAQSQKNSYSNVSGLEFRAGYDRKYGSGSDDIYEDFYSYKNQFNAMISWNILKSGLVGRTLNEELIDLESQKLLLDKRSAMSTEQIRLHYKMQEQVLDGYRNNIYKVQVEIYKSLISLTDYLLNQGQATSIELSQIQMEMQIAKGAIRDTPTEIENLLNLTEYILLQAPITEQDVELLAQNSTAVEQSKLKEEIIKNEVKGVNYWDEVSVSPYVKAQHYSDAKFTTSRKTANIGVSATLPILSGTKSKRNAVQARSTIAANSTSTTKTSVSLLINESAMQLNKNLERLKAAEKLEKLYKEQIKIAYESYKFKKLTVSELAKYYINLLALQEEMVEMIDDRESLKLKLLLITI